MRRSSAAFVAGLVFGLGLILSGMANPVKVLAFLDVAGAWDPSLALVMAGAIAVAFPAFRAASGRATSLLGESMQLPRRREVDRPLMVGSLIFGAGWGLAGICPGPGIVLVGFGSAKGAVFVVAFCAAMAGLALVQRRRLASLTAAR